MPRNNRYRGRQRSNWVRPVDWDFAEVSTVIGGGADPQYVWLRVPSDSTDLAAETFIAPKTLVRTMVRGMAITDTLVDNSYFGLYMGIIVWHGNADNTVPSALSGPDPTNGALDWIFYAPSNVATAGLGVSESQFNWGIDGDWKESRAQRKLPPGAGILLALYSTPNATYRARWSFRLALKGDVTAPGLGGG